MWFIYKQKAAYAKISMVWNFKNRPLFLKNPCYTSIIFFWKSPSLRWKLTNLEDACLINFTVSLACMEKRKGSCSWKRCFPPLNHSLSYFLPLFLLIAVLDQGWNKIVLVLYRHILCTSSNQLTWSILGASGRFPQSIVFNFMADTIRTAVCVCFINPKTLLFVKRNLIGHEGWSHLTIESDPQ